MANGDMDGPPQSDSKAVFRTNDWDCLRELYRLHRDDPDWDSNIRTDDRFEEQLAEWAFRSWLQEGQIDVLTSEDGRPLGLIVLLLHPGDDTSPRFLELGTYLVPEVRGTGMNRYCKERAVDLARHVYGVDWLVCAIPANNVRAMRGMNRLNWSTMETYAGEPIDHPFHTFWKRRCFVTEQRVTLYLIPVDQ